MLSVLEDITVLAVSRMITIETAKKWMDDLLYLLNARVLNYFELQFFSPTNLRIGGYKYTLSEDGSLHENSQSGGIDPYDLLRGAGVKLFADIDYSKKNIPEVLQYLTKQGWGTNGTSLCGQAVFERAYSKDGYGIKRFKVSL